MGSFFSIDSKFSQFMSRVFDLMLLNFIFIIMCIPIVTIGANITAMYYVVIKMVRGEDSYVFRSYWKSFKENFKQSTILWVIALVVGILLGFDLYLTFTMLKGGIQNIKFVFFFFFILYAFMLMYVFPTQSRFYNPIKYTLKNSLLLSIRHLPYTIIMLVLSIGPTLFAVFAAPKIFSIYLLVMVLFGFSVTAYLCAILFNKIFKRYMPEEEESAEQSEEDVIRHMDELDAQDKAGALEDGSEDADADTDDVADAEDVYPPVSDVETEDVYPPVSEAAADIYPPVSNTAAEDEESRKAE